MATNLWDKRSTYLSSKNEFLLENIDITDGFKQEYKMEKLKKKEKQVCFGEKLANAITIR